MRDVELFTVYEDADSRTRRYSVQKTLVTDTGLRDAERTAFEYLEQVRSMLARLGLTRVPRGTGDEPRLVETWL